MCGFPERQPIHFEVGGTRRDGTEIERSPEFVVVAPAADASVHGWAPDA